MKFFLIYLLLLNSITFLAFGYDKWKAKHNKQRISERNIFAMVLFGGTIGGLIGMRGFRHKTQKKSFQLVFYSILILQVIILFLLRKYF